MTFAFPMFTETAYEAAVWILSKTSTEKFEFNPEVMYRRVQKHPRRFSKPSIYVVWHYCALSILSIGDTWRNVASTDCS